MDSTSSWANPLVPVVKPDSSIRLCVDYRALNSITPPIRYWLPTLQEILHKVGQSQVISTLDLTSGFHQIPVSENSSDLTTFVGERDTLSRSSMKNAIRIYIYIYIYIYIGT